jgi:hypothetical protein
MGGKEAFAFEGWSSADFEECILQDYQKETAINFVRTKTDE